MFLEYLRELRRKNGTKRIAVFMDNLAVHKGDEVLTEMTKLNMVRIFNVPYSPEFNPIESVFSIVKQQFKRDRLIRVQYNRHPDIKKLILKAFYSVDKKAIQACIRKSLHLL